MSTRQNIEILFEQNESDNKHKLNTAPGKIIADNLLEQIEKTGCDIEFLETLDVPVYKYQTQITIHGIFSELGTNYIGCYKNIFQNKNKSIGVKWSAVDFTKKKIISKYIWAESDLSRKNYFDFKPQNFRFNLNSSSCTITKSYAVHNSEEFEQAKKECFGYKNKIDGLYFGSAQILKYSLFGQLYVAIEIYFSGIYEKNLDAFLSVITGFKNKEHFLKLTKQAENIDALESAIDKAKYKLIYNRNLSADTDKLNSWKATTKLKTLTAAPKTDCLLFYFETDFSGHIKKKCIQRYAQKNGKVIYIKLKDLVPADNIRKVRDRDIIPQSKIQELIAAGRMWFYSAI